MAIRNVVQCQCDRCGKVEEVSKTMVPSVSEVTFTYKGSTVDYSDLCKKCRPVIERIAKLMEKPKKREKKPKS